MLVLALGPACSGPAGSEGGDDLGESSESSSGEIESSSEAGSDSETETETGEAQCPGVGPWDLGTPIPAAEPPAGDPEAGLAALLEDDYVDCGIPYDLFMLGKGFLGTYADAEAWDWRAGKNATVPYNWNVITSDGGTDLAVMNCLTCHAGSIDGELIIGLGRADVDYTTDFSGTLAAIPELPEITDAGKELPPEMQKAMAVHQAIVLLAQHHTGSKHGLVQAPLTRVGEGGMLRGVRYGLRLLQAIVHLGHGPHHQTQAPAAIPKGHPER